ncbi:MAG: nucleotidyltransferase [Ignavibacteria bacterium]|nr:nucleotidyltransferase [Ignavibacteria bacterium]
MQGLNNEDFKEFLKLLIENEVEYLVVGGYAVSFYSRPRYTDDLDLWINKTRENLQRLKKALADFGFDSKFIEEDEFLNKTKVYRMGNPPLRIEILNKIDGVKFEDAIKKKVNGKYADIESVNFISLDDLITNKSSANRTKDKLDLETLKTFRKKD